MNATFGKSEFIQPLDEALLKEVGLRRIVENENFISFLGIGSDAQLEIDVSEKFGTMHGVVAYNQRRLNLKTMDEAIKALADFGYLPAVSYTRRKFIDDILNDLA